MHYCSQFWIEIFITQQYHLHNQSKIINSAFQQIPIEDFLGVKNNHIKLLKKEGKHN